MSFWWVNHNVTAAQEIDGGYLWSPKTMRNGRKSHFYDNMRRACPGDKVVSFAKSKIGHFGIVNELARSAETPPEFGLSGDLWDKDGWRVPVRWFKLKSPFRPKAHIELIRPFLRSQYSPIRSDGNGNQVAYLCQIDSELFDLLMQIGQTDMGEYLSHKRLGDG